MQQTRLLIIYKAQRLVFTEETINHIFVGLRHIRTFQINSRNALIGGLQKLESWSKRIPMDASPATAHMFIIKPFTGQSFMKLFSTHPSTEDRIARLQAQR